MPTNTYRDRQIIVIATGFKFLRDTPDRIRGKIIDYVFSDDDTEMPVSLQPYKDNIKLLEQHIKATELSEACDVDEEEKKKVDDEFDNITEEDFIKLYREWRKQREDRRKSTDSGDNKT